MQNRKKLNREIERSKKQKRRMSAGIGVLIVLLICAGIAWFAVGVYQRSWVIRFEGQRISTNELRFILQSQDWMWTPQDQIVDRAMDMLIHTLTVMHHANNLGLGMTDEERDEMLEFIGNERGVISNTRMAEFFSTEFMQDRLFDYFMPELILDPEIYRYDIEAYIEARRPFYAQTEIMYILNDDFDILSSIRGSTLNDPDANFADYVMQYCSEHIDFGIEEPTVLGLADLEHVINPFDMAEVAELQPGETSQIIMFGESFLLLYMHSRVEASDAEMQEAFLSNWSREIRMEAFIEFFDELVENARYEINQRALDAL